MANHRKLDIEKAIHQRNVKGMTLQEIADNHGVTKQAVSQQLQKIENAGLLSLYKDKRADIFAEKQAEIIQSLDRETIKEMSGLQRITGLGILYDKERLERGQSTDNVDIRTLSISLDGRIDELRRLLMPTSGAVEVEEMQD